MHHCCCTACNLTNNVTDCGTTSVLRNRTANQHSDTALVDAAHKPCTQDQYCSCERMVKGVGSNTCSRPAASSVTTHMATCVQVAADPAMQALVHCPPVEGKHVLLNETTPVTSSEAGHSEECSTKGAKLQAWRMCLGQCSQLATYQTLSAGCSTPTLWPMYCCHAALLQAAT
jgi:hypothetical protein